MQILDVKQFDQRNKADVLLLPFWEGDKNSIEAFSISSMKDVIEAPLSCGDFLGKQEESLLFYTNDHVEKRVLLVGLGKKENADVESIRKAFASAVNQCKKKKITSLNLVFPISGKLPKKQIFEGMIEGLYLSNYAFDRYKTKKETLIEKTTIIGVEKNEEAFIKKAKVIAEGVHFARDLVNNNADDETPDNLATIAKAFSKISPMVSVTVFDKKRIEKEKMKLLLAVAKGASIDPRFIIITYKGNPSSKDHTVLVGKGITYDTGGLSLKPSTGMDTMKSDMAGAAAVLGVAKVAAELKLKVNLTCVVPATENAIGPSSYKPGDVFGSYSGKTVEVVNTDAEGRLILADALAYAVKELNPTRIVDVATLTGAITIALGEEIGGLFCNDEKLSKELLKSAENTGEHLCRLPLYPGYKELLKSSVADIRNVGGRPAGSIIAGLFLEEFVGSVPWAHIDIDGWLSKAKGYSCVYATGYGVRLLIDFLAAL